MSELVFTATRQGRLHTPCLTLTLYPTNDVRAAYKGAPCNAALMAFTKSLGARSLHYGVRMVGSIPGQSKPTAIPTY